MKKKVLDHGYVELIEAWGSDERIIEAARMSTGKGFTGWGPKHSGNCTTQGPNWENGCNCGCNHPGDEKLLKFLYSNNHSTPFEMGGMVIEVQAPIFVFREWHRHRTQSYNEMSARYTPLPDVNYVPTTERLMLNADGSNKQAGTIAGAEALTEEHAKYFQERLITSYAKAQGLYDDALSWGVPKELARVHLPVGRYSRMRASANLRNWLAFLTLRTAKSAQWEIRQYAIEVSLFIAEKFPRTHALLSSAIENQPS